MSSPSLLCSLSGQSPVEPVLARTSGLLFERRLIERALELNGNVCPRTNTPLTKEDLIPVKTLSVSSTSGSSAAATASEVVKPRPASATSIPGLLSLLQGEWDAVVLEAFQLKQALETTKQDLAHALYKEDAANRVIARLLKERDAAQAALLATEQNLKAAIKSGGGATSNSSAATPMELDSKSAAPAALPGALPSYVEEKVNSTVASLSKTRKATVKEAQAAVASQTEIQQFKIQGQSHPLHKTTNPGILSLDLSRANQDLVLTGGNDGQALLFNVSNGKIVRRFEGHQSAVTAVKFHPTREVFFTASTDHTAAVWNDSLSYTLTGAKDAITGLSLHASGDFALTGSKDGSWALFDVNNGKELKRVHGSIPLTGIQFHPDGALLGAAGNDGALRVFDLKTGKAAAVLKDASNSTAVSAIAFSENGYHCASAEGGGAIRLWDLRKLANFQTIRATANEGDKAGSIVATLAFDDSVSYLAAGVGSRVAVYNTKSWEEVIGLNDHKDKVTAVAWGSQARKLVSVSLDRNLKVWA